MDSECSIESQNAPRGRPKSGRVWKSVRTARHSDLKRDKPLRTSWEMKMKAKAEKGAVKLYESQLKQAVQEERQKLKERRALNKKRREENERKGEVVQKITNTRKLKRMKKKQLRRIEKR